MTGQELFNRYTAEVNEYSQTLQTAVIHFGTRRVYALLEEAEPEGKQIRLLEDLEVLGEPYGMRLTGGTNED